MYNILFNFNKYLLEISKYLCRYFFAIHFYFDCLISDIDECEGDSGCSHTCSNFPGGFLCQCFDGFTLDLDGKQCNGKKNKHQQQKTFLL